MAIVSYILSVVITREECDGFVQIRYSYKVALLMLIKYFLKVACITHAYKIVCGSVPDLSNYGHLFIHFVYLVCYLRE